MNYKMRPFIHPKKKEKRWDHFKVYTCILVKLLNFGLKNIFHTFNKLV